MVVEKSIMVESFGMAQYLGGGNSNMFGILTPKIEENSHFDEYFLKGLKPPTRYQF